MKSNGTRFTKIVYNVLLSNAQNRKVNWVYMLKKLIEAARFWACITL